MTPEFRRRLNREIKLFIRETKDGCNDCQAMGVCNEHRKVFIDLALNPRKYIKINADEFKK